MKRFACPGVAALRAVAWAVGLMTGSFAAAPAQAITYELVPVGNPGNAHDVYGYGGVDAARFANWMSNGQPAGGQTGATTENGAYELNGATTGDAVARNTVNPNTGAAPSFFIPLENEWYKAAYHDPTRDGGAGGYALFATRSDTPPDNLIGGAVNQANYLTANGDYCVTQSGDFSSSQNYLTDAGVFTGSPSFYGTFDQNGGLWEWNDLDGTAHPNRGVRGGAYTSTPPYLQSSYRMGYVPSGSNPNGGFRLAGPDG